MTGLARVLLRRRLYQQYRRVSNDPLPGDRRTLRLSARVREDVARTLSSIHDRPPPFMEAGFDFACPVLFAGRTRQALYRYRSKRADGAGCDGEASMHESFVLRRRHSRDTRSERVHIVALATEFSHGCEDADQQSNTTLYSE